ncbi:MAG: hypothetical protein GY870_05765 [archaeon]|nr:hypothetical protein [archaeon]
MTKLIGSEKQIKWANEIRENLLNENVDMESLRNKVQRRNKTLFKKDQAEQEVLTEDQLDSLINKGLELFKTANSASYWIDVKSDRIVGTITDMCFHSKSMEAHK